MNDLTYILNQPEWLPDGYAVEQRGTHWRVTTPSGRLHAVTTDRSCHNYAAGTVDFFGPRSSASPGANKNQVTAADGGTSSSLSIGAILNTTDSD